MTITRADLDRAADTLFELPNHADIPGTRLTLIALSADGRKAYTTQQSMYRTAQWSGNDVHVKDTGFLVGLIANHQVGE